MSREERDRLMAENAPEIGSIHWGNVYFDWSWQGCGFGQLDFRVDRETGKISCANEFMGRERVREILIAFANHVADTCVLDDDEFKENPTS